MNNNPVIELELAQTVFQVAATENSLKSFYGKKRYPPVLGDQEK